MTTTAQPFLQLVKTFPVEGVGSIINIPKPPMLVKDLIPEGAFMLLTAPAYSGKTFFALELARAVVTGEPFMGEFPVEKRGNVLLVEQDSPKYDTGRALWTMLKRQWAEEGDAFRENEGYSCLDGLFMAWHPGLDIKNRMDVGQIAQTANGLAAYRGSYTVPHDHYHYDEDGNVIGIEPAGSDVVHDVRRGAALIILDTYSALHTADEDNRSEIEPIMQSMKILRAATGATILLIHHDNAMGTRARGSTALDGAVDHWFSLSKTKKGIACKIRKARAVQPASFVFEVATEDDPTLGTTKAVRFKQFLDERRDDEPADEGNLLAYLLTRPEGVTVADLEGWRALNNVGENKVRAQLEGLVKAGLALKLKDPGRAGKMRYHAVRKEVAGEEENA